MDAQKMVSLSDRERQGAKALADVPQDLTTAQELASTIPEFTKKQRGDLQLEYTERRGKLIFHVYHAVRRQLVAEALSEADQDRQNQARLIRLEDALMERLERHPWWDDVGVRLYNTFSDFFRADAHVVFDPEVDSWSVTVPVPALPTAWTAAAQDLLFNKLFTSLYQG